MVPLELLATAKVLLAPREVRRAEAHSTQVKDESSWAPQVASLLGHWISS